MLMFENFNVVVVLKVLEIRVQVQATTIKPELVGNSLS